MVLLALLLTPRVAAEMVGDLYSARVPVADQGASALAAGAREALSVVLVKVSGSTEVLGNPVIAEALGNARGQVQQYAYQRGATAEEGLWARFEFDGNYITDLVTRAGVPLWTANRPPVLAWVVIEDDGGRRFVNRETLPEETRLLEQEFARRGVPVKLPLFDLTDTAGLSVDQVWQLDAVALRAASERYNVQDIAAGRLTALSTGGVAGDWVYLHLDQRQDRPLSAPDLREFFRAGVAVVATGMAGRYAVAPTAASELGVLMSVSGVGNYADYAGIVSWLEGLEVVEFANLEQIEGDTIRLRLRAQADPQQLATLIQLNRRLVPSTLPQPGVALAYQWQK